MFGSPPPSTGAPPPTPGLSPPHLLYGGVLGVGALGGHPLTPIDSCSPPALGQSLLVTASAARILS